MFLVKLLITVPHSNLKSKRYFLFVSYIGKWHLLVTRGRWWEYLKKNNIFLSSIFLPWQNISISIEGKDNHSVHWVFFVTLKHFLSLISSTNFMTNSSKKRKLSLFLSTKRILLNFILVSQICVYYVQIYSCSTFI